ncbi:hypothetical protein J4Q44_G00197470 [Coregonus suidteri]|uniref:Uncharacterized protein n=1 Tax=Coregonus suidteri TaxID=861788 RepID=A0AAN8LT17_9TELE
MQDFVCVCLAFRVATARNESLQRRQEANQYKLRAGKQLGLRPSTADAEWYRQPEQDQGAGYSAHPHIPYVRRQDGTERQENVQKKPLTEKGGVEDRGGRKIRCGSGQGTPGAQNFEESEDELREEVAESMINLFIMEDGASAK